MLLDFDEHRVHRRIMQGAFSREALICYLQVLTPGITAGLDQWQPRDGFLIFDHLKKLTLDLASEVFMGRKPRSEEHTSELQSLMRISYAVFCLKQQKHTHQQ